VIGRDGSTTLLVFHLLDGQLRVVDAASGTPRWTANFGKLARAAPTVVDLDGDGMLEVIASEVGEPGDLVCLRLHDGVELWRRPGLAGHQSSTVALDLDGDRALELLHTSHEQGVLALDRHGQTRWQFTPRTGPERPDGGGLVTDLDGDGALEFVTSFRDGVVYVLDARSGTFRWQYRTGGRVEAPPVAVDGDGDATQELVIAGHDRILHVVRSPGVRP
jgi:outer membrane protein assembly factor BamB